MNTKYPLVLVHGVAVRDTFFMKSFGYVDRMLRIQGYTVYKSKVDGFGTVENNAAILKAEIEDILAETHAKKVNIIAHSKGGLDARHMLEHMDMAKSVATLTTLCTPHMGSPIASLFMRLPKWIARVVAFFMDAMFRILGDRNPDSYTVCRELMRVPVSEQAVVKPIPGVFCQSFSSALRKGDKKADFLMQIPYMISRLVEKTSDTDTDGLVPRDSARFGKYRGDCIDDSAGHAEIADFFVSGKKHDRILAFWSALCEELVEMGY
ncbi:MAG: esterase/lipase family protein [Christensenellales bacterium]|jgi:triacylglycerol lipase